MKVDGEIREYYRELDLLELDDTIVDFEEVNAQLERGKLISCSIHIENDFSFQLREEKIRYL